MKKVTSALHHTSTSSGFLILSPAGSSQICRWLAELNADGCGYKSRRWRGTVFLPRDSCGCWSKEFYRIPHFWEGKLHLVDRHLVDRHLVDSVFEGLPFMKWTASQQCRPPRQSCRAGYGTGFHLPDTHGHEVCCNHHDVCFQVSAVVAFDRHSSS